MQTARFPSWAGFEPPPEHFLSNALFETQQISKRALFLFSEKKPNISFKGVSFGPR